MFSWLQKIDVSLGAMIVEARAKMRFILKWKMYL